MPTIEIVPAADPLPLRALAASLAEFDLVIFVSANAARFAIPVLTAERPWPRDTLVAAVGAKTAAALAQLGVAVQLSPGSPFNSEALLALPELQTVAGSRVVVLRGGEGRELLAATLRERGAQVVLVDVYRRIRPRQIAPEVVRELERRGVDVIMATSAEGLENLVALSDGGLRAKLLDTVILLGSARLAETARALGFRIPPVIVANPSDESMFEGLCDWARTKRIQQ